MRKKQVDIKKGVMDRIHHEHIRMKPRAYFVMGTALSLLGLAALTVTAVFLVGVTRFLLRSHGPMGQYRFEELMSSFPLWIPGITLVFLAAGIWSLRQYDFSYRKNFRLIAFGFLISVVIAGWVIDATGLNDVWFRQGPMRGIMRQYLEREGIRITPGWMRNGQGPR